MSEERKTQNYHYCRNLVRQHAEDLYLGAQFAPADKVTGLIANYAFAVEVHRIPDSVSEPPLGAIRQQWWRDALQELVDGKTPRAHPVVEALQLLHTQNARAGELYKNWLKAIDAIDDYLEVREFQSVSDILQSADKLMRDVTRNAFLILDEAELVEVDILSSYIRLVAISFILQQLFSQKLSDGNGQVDSFSARLERCSHDLKGELLSTLVAEHTQLTSTLAKPATSLMPALVPTTLSSLYLRKLRHGKVQEIQGTPLISLRKRMKLFYSILKGVI